MLKLLPWTFCSNSCYFWHFTKQFKTGCSWDLLTLIMIVCCDSDFFSFFFFWRGGENQILLSIPNRCLKSLSLTASFNRIPLSKTLFWGALWIYMEKECSWMYVFFSPWQLLCNFLFIKHFLWRFCYLLLLIFIFLNIFSSSVRKFSVFLFCFYWCFNFFKSCITSAAWQLILFWCVADCLILTWSLGLRNTSCFGVNTSF